MMAQAPNLKIGRSLSRQPETDAQWVEDELRTEEALQAVSTERLILYALSEIVSYIEKGHDHPQRVALGKELWRRAEGRPPR
jgi:hypothetical protein